MVRPGVAIVAAALLCASGCTSDLTDDKQSLLRKAEILSVVLDPPESAPGGLVAASYLAGDAAGVLAPVRQLWLPLDLAAEDGGSLVGLRLDTALREAALLGLTAAQLEQPRIELTAKAAAALRFEEGVASQPLGLVLLLREDPRAASTELLLQNLAELLRDGLVKVARRSLAVSTRSARNDNPRLLRVEARRDDGSSSAAATVCSWADELEDARALASAAPIDVRPGEEISLEVIDEDAGEERSFQWISPGGDFHGRRERVQPWTAPMEAPAAPIPVWVIIRDEAGGQSWCELYARVAR